MEYFPCPQCNDAFVLSTWGPPPWQLTCACGWSGTVGVPLTEADIRRIVREELHAWQDEVNKAQRLSHRAGMNGGVKNF